MINIKVDLNGVDRKFLLLEKNVPYAISNSINRTLMKAQEAQKRYMGRTFMIRKPGLLKATVRMLKFSNKSTLTGTMGINPKLYFWAIHEKGGIERPTRSKYIAAPLEVKRSKRGSIPKGQRPRNLKNSFVRQGTGGTKIIFQRKGKGKREKVTPMYSLIRQARYKPALNFYRNVNKAINRLWKIEAQRAVDEQIRMARLR